MELDVSRHSAILLFQGLPASTSQLELVDWLWSSIGLGLQEVDVTLRPVANGGMNAIVRIPRRSLALYLDRIVAQLSFNGRSVCVRAKHPERPPRPEEGR